MDWHYLTTTITTTKKNLIIFQEIFCCDLYNYLQSPDWIDADTVKDVGKKKYAKKIISLLSVFGIFFRFIQIGGNCGKHLIIILPRSTCSNNNKTRCVFLRIEVKHSFFYNFTIFTSRQYIDATLYVNLDFRKCSSKTSWVKLICL